MQEMQVQSLGWEDPLEEGMATHSSILAWKIPWREEPGRLQSIVNWSNLAHTHTGEEASRCYRSGPPLALQLNKWILSICHSFIHSICIWGHFSFTYVIAFWSGAVLDSESIDNFVTWKWKSLSHVCFFATPWTIACQAPLSMWILQARLLEWVAMPSSRGSSQPRDQTQVSLIAGRFFTIWATREAHLSHLLLCSFILHFLHVQLSTQL